VGYKLAIHVHQYKPLAAYFQLAVQFPAFIMNFLSEVCDWNTEYTVFHKIYLYPSHICFHGDLGGRVIGSVTARKKVYMNACLILIGY
jgi:hypothetical protein